MNFVSKIKANLFSIFQTALIVLLAILLIVFVGVIFFKSVEQCISGLIGVTTKNEILIFLGIGIGGILIVLLALKIKENPLLIFQVILIVLLIALAVGFVVVMFFETKWIFDQLGIPEKEKNRALTFLGIGMGGVLVALQALASHRRAKAMEDTAKHAEQGQRQERLKNAIEHLGNEKESVRWGGAYELYHLAEDSKEFSQTVLDMLCLQIRQMTSETIYRVAHQSKPSEEVQSLLTLLFVQKHEVFKGCDINLQGSWLKGANLGKARLAKAVLYGAHLQDANLIDARLQGARLEGAHLQDARLDRAHLQGAKLGTARLQKVMLTDAQLQGADFRWAHLKEAILDRANLQGADLNSARLQRANLYQAHLQGTNLKGAKLQRANLNDARLQGAHLQDANLTGALQRGIDPTKVVQLQGAGKVSWSSDMSFAKRIKSQIDQETDLSGVIIEGEVKRNIDSYADTGAYTKKEAKKWIAEYEEAMSEVPEGDS